MLSVADECHRYGSEMNQLALDERMTRRLGLSATYAPDDDGHRDRLDSYFGGMCFELGYPEAVADGVVAEPVVALLGVSLQADERAGDDEYTETIGQMAALLVERHGGTRHPYAAFISEVNLLADQGSDSAASNRARRYRHAVLDRRRLLADARVKQERLGDLVPAVNSAQRTIVFTQSIAASETPLPGSQPDTSPLAPSTRASRPTPGATWCGSSPQASCASSPRHASSTKASTFPRPTSP